MYMLKQQVHDKENMAPDLPDLTTSHNRELLNDKKLRAPKLELSHKY